MTRLEAQKRAKIRRKALSDLSRLIKPLVQAGQFDSVNDGLLHTYREETGQSVFHTFRDWRERGCFVNKGETGYPIWSRPMALQDKPEGADETETSSKPERRVFRMAYLFHYGQVTDHSKVAVTV